MVCSSRHRNFPPGEYVYHHNTDWRGLRVPCRVTSVDQVAPSGGAFQLILVRPHLAASCAPPQLLPAILKLTTTPANHNTTAATKVTKPSLSIANLHLYAHTHGLFLLQKTLHPTGFANCQLL